MFENTMNLSQRNFKRLRNDFFKALYLRNVDRIVETPTLQRGILPFITRYKSLADIERGFRMLTSEIEIGPVFHRLPKRNKAHAAICFMAHDSPSHHAV